LVPFLILAASILLAIQENVKTWLSKKANQAGRAPISDAGCIVPVGLAAIYGGYFVQDLV